MDRGLEFLAKWEGGWAEHPRDPGGATMRGITIGTFTRWRQANGLPAPTKEDLRNITDEDVAGIYDKWYYKASGANKLSFPLCLVVFDTAVLHGVGAAQTWLAESGGDPQVFLDKRIASYKASSNWDVFGAGWMNRANDLAKVAGLQGG